ncbi:hypothetical protein GCM10023220_48210 [Streptomyces ziwulingensis]|uniref:Uncharacterized protein n=1 Tax=Streptomyces ziwulingensis TaxID=1045501 RepID=A0ABP9CN06_9ACTN
MGRKRVPEPPDNTSAFMRGTLLMPDRPTEGFRTHLRSLPSVRAFDRRRAPAVPADSEDGRILPTERIDTELGWKLLQPFTYKTRLVNSYMYRGS